MNKIRLKSQPKRNVAENQLTAKYRFDSGLKKCKFRVDYCVAFQTFVFSDVECAHQMPTWFRTKVFFPIQPQRILYSLSRHHDNRLFALLFFMNINIFVNY